MKAKSERKIRKNRKEVKKGNLLKIRVELDEVPVGSVQKTMLLDVGPQSIDHLLPGALTNAAQQLCQTRVHLELRGLHREFQ